MTKGRMSLEGLTLGVRGESGRSGVETRVFRKFRVRSQWSGYLIELERYILVRKEKIKDNIYECY